MLNRDKPIGQRRGDGLFFGLPFEFHWGLRRAGFGAPPRHRRDARGWVSRVGAPHGRSGDKLVRKAWLGTAGLTKPRGMYAEWHMKPKTKKARVNRAL